jgi:TPR repeat protein
VREGLLTLLLATAATACRGPAATRGEPATATADGASAALRQDGAPQAASVDPCRIAGSRAPLLSRWTNAQRDDLESAMRSGIAVLSADDCHGVRLLPACHARGRYGYLGKTAQLSSVDLATEEELRINAPVPDVSTTGDAGNHPIHLDLAIVGQRATTRGLLSPGELTGDCAKATHFVTGAEVGAATTAPARAPDAGAVPSSCRAAHPGDLDPPAGCRTLVEIRIEPIAELGEFITYDRAPKNTVAPIGVCPQDMVVSRGKCARPPVDAPYLCAFGDAAGCREQCGRGDLNSCDVLGFMQWHGKGLDKNLALAAATYAKGCDQGDSLACANLAFFEYEGQGVPKDAAKAATLYERACSLGTTSACGDLGVAYLNGVGVAADPARGLSLLERACDAGSADTCYLLTQRLLRGDVVPGDPPRARTMLDELCDVDEALACSQLARMHFLGEGFPADHARATPLFTKACRAGDDKACVMLGLQYRQADGVARDDVQATQLMEYACSHGYAEGCLNLGIAYEHGKGVAADTKRAAALYEQACTGGDATGCMYFGDSLKGGVGVERSDWRAQSFYSRACEMGEKMACPRK